MQYDLPTVFSWFLHYPNIFAIIIIIWTSGHFYNCRIQHGIQGKFF